MCWVLVLSVRCKCAISVHKAWFDDEFFFHFQPLVIYQTVLKKCSRPENTRLCLSSQPTSVFRCPLIFHSRWPWHACTVSRCCLTCQLILAASHITDSPGALHSPWQKVTASEQTTPIFLYTMIRCLFWGMTGRGGLFERPLHHRVREVRAYGTLWGVFGILTALLVPA